MTVEEIQKSTEFQVFDRKSARIDAKALMKQEPVPVVPGEGVDRMFREMEEAGQPAPEYKQNEFMVYATIRQHGDAAGQVAGNGGLNGELNGDITGKDKGS